MANKYAGIVTIKNPQNVGTWGEDKTLIKGIVTYPGDESQEKIITVFKDEDGVMVTVVRKTNPPKIYQVLEQK